MKQFNFDEVIKDFENKLSNGVLKTNTISSIVSRINRINNQRDILKEYDRDGCVSLLEDLDFTKEDQQNGREPIIDIPVGSDYAKGFASLKSALNRFVEFLNKSGTQYESSNISDSPIFIGSFKDFNRYIGPACRNCVQNICRAERKKRKGVCEDCGFGNKELQSAHIEDRPKIIKKILNTLYKNGNGVYKVKVDEFISRFKDYQKPVNNHILFLCESCHKKLDKLKGNKKQNKINKIITNRGGITTMAITTSPNGKTNISKAAPKTHN